MSLIGKFKKDDSNGMASMALLLGAAATAGVVVLSIRANNQERRIIELQEALELNAAVTLNLTNAVGRMAHVANNQ